MMEKANGPEDVLAADASLPPLDTAVVDWLFDSENGEESFALRML
jgi:hypothetical protein